jgi:hypothetical protein
MNNSFSGFAPCGMEVSARTLLVALGPGYDCLTYILLAAREDKRASH